MALTPIQKAIQGLQAKGYSEQQIDEMIDNCSVDPGYLDRFTEWARKVDDRQKSIDWAISDDQLIVRYK